MADLEDDFEDSDEIDENEDRKINESDTVLDLEDPEAQIDPKVEPSRSSENWLEKVYNIVQEAYNGTT